MTWNLVTGTEPGSEVLRDRPYVLRVTVQYFAAAHDPRDDRAVLNVQIPQRSSAAKHSARDLALATQSLIMNEVDTALRILVVDAGMLPRPTREQTARDRASLWLEVAFLELAPDQAEVSLACGSEDLTLRRQMANGTTLHMLRRNITAALANAMSGPALENAIAAAR